MPMQRVQIDVPIVKGASQKSDLRWSGADEAAQMVNCVRLKDNTVQKRFGNVALSKVTTNTTVLLGVPGTLGTGVAGGSLAGAPWLVDGAGLIHEYSDVAGQWRELSRTCEVAVLDRMAADASGGVSAVGTVDCDVVQCNGYLFVAYLLRDPSFGASLPNNAIVTVLDATTGALVGKFTPSIGNHLELTPHIFACGTTVILTYVRHDLGQIMAHKLDATIPYNGFSSATAIVSDGAASVTANGIYDSGPIVGDATRFAVAYEASGAEGFGAGVHIKTFRVSTLAQLSDDPIDTATTGIVAIAYRGTSGEVLWAGYSGIGADTHMQTVAAGADDVTPGLVYASTTLLNWAVAGPSPAPGRITVERIDSINAVVMWSNTATAPAQQGIQAQQIKRFGLGTTAQTGPARFTPCLELWSRLTLVPGVGAYAMARSMGTLQGTLMLLAFDWFADITTAQPYPGRLVATVSPRLAKSIVNYGGASPNFAHGCCSLTLVPQQGSGTAYACVSLTNTSPFQAAIHVQLFDFASTQRCSSAEVGPTVSFAAGAPQCLDGQRSFELGFPWYPEGMTAAAAGGAGFLSAGKYSYIWVYEWYDARGQVHRSATSAPVTLTVAANNTVTFSLLPSMGLAARGGPIPGFPAQASGVYIVPYRTLVNGTIYYRLVSDPPPAGLLCPSTIGTLTTMSAITYADITADAAISSSALLYTTGGVLDTFSPPCARACVAHKGRIWLAGGDDPTIVWPSRQFTPGEIPGFNEALNFQATGAVRALASMDDKLVFFVQRGASFGVEYVTGEGPTDLGTQSDWTSPQQVPSGGVGAVDQRSVCVGPFGCLFRSPVGGPKGKGGLFVLTRSMEVQYASGPVEDTLAANPVVTSAVVHPTAGRVYITCAPSDVSASGVRLVWDYLHGGAWSIDTLFDPDGPNSSVAVRQAWVAASSSQGLAYHWVTPAGRVYRETNGVGANAYTDAGAYVTSTYQSAWIKPTLSGFARFWRVLTSGTALDPADMTMRLLFDYSPPDLPSASLGSFYQETSSWAAAQIATFDRNPIVDVQMIPGNQKAKAISIVLQDAAPTGGPTVTTGQGFLWAGFSIDLGVKEGSYQNLPKGQRA